MSHQSWREGVITRSDRDRRFMPNREVHRVSDEAHSMGFIMEVPCDVYVTATDRNDRMKHCRRESSTSVIGLNHHPLSFVPVAIHNYPAHSTEMEVRQHVARRERGDKEFFGIVPTWIASEHWVRRPQQIGLRFGLDQVVSPIRPIVASSRAVVSRPSNDGPIGMRFRQSASASASPHG